MDDLGVEKNSIIVSVLRKVCDSTIVEMPSKPEKEFLRFCLYNALHAEAGISVSERLIEGSSKEKRRITEG